ncbi:cytochrome c biogenesis protein CcdA [Flavobacterium sp. DG1-102-2]|uniref:protein-disulfide reductase DsbD family protein n=1 Tax=Flavobacterium sp. DG1-102-2 TaxID=3081663 RepID=UPI00294A4EB6|nr:cytochrome c biogenesis protein CcdA [Flavobacterium sp. DG1-102-2]MDV6167346.1 cytochrome c biogenesis protein CcdA [Flavobacterium sp. DG1-102-2]
MKKASLLFFFLFAFLTLQAQPGAGVIEPVKWTSKIEKKSDTEFILIFNATIEDKWHMYSQFTDENGALPMEVIFNNNKGNFEAVGKAEESKTEKAFNETFGVDETFWSHNAQLKQTVKITNSSNTILQVELAYQVCKEVCIQGDKLFQFDTKALTATEVTNFEDIKTTAAGTEKKKEAEAVATPKENDKSGEDKTNPWTIFLGTLLAGIFVTFTPCVFPMIPMTVSFFIKQNSGNQAKGKFNAVFYGFCIILIYVLLSIPFHIFEGLDGNIFADISTNVYLNLFFFIVFVVFAISFLGAFEITIPSSLANKADNASNSGGLIGIFFMALTLIIVSFSCTGPALGFVFGTVLSSDGGALLVSLAMFGFGLGLSMPFMFFALFPSLMGNLPKSGGWLNTVKVVFGFIELALAFKFLSNADLVLQLHWLEREIFLAIWIAIFAALTLYLFGKFSTPHDSPVPFLSVGRTLLAVLAFTFTVYLIPGLWGAPLKLLSGITPPLNYSEAPFGFGGGGNSPSAADSFKLPDGAAPAVHGIIAFEDYEKGLAYAKEVNKPVLLDFTGRACVNCRKMEESVWSDPAVLTILKNDVVLISLYGDEQKDLPESEQFVSKYSGRKITTVGKKWSDFQLGRYNSNARPYYVLMGLDEKNLNEPVAYTPDIEEYLTWLTTGIANFK